MSLDVIFLIKKFLSGHSVNRPVI